MKGRTLRRWRVKGRFTARRYYYWTYRGAMRLARRRGSDGSQLFDIDYYPFGWPK